MRLAFFVVMLAGLSPLFAQESKQNQFPATHFDRGVELYREGRFNAAVAQFRSYLNLVPDGTQRAEAEYYYSISKLKAGHTDGVPSLQQFLDQNPGSLKTTEANLALGDFYYLKSKYSSALRYYKNVDEKAIDKPLRSQFNYRKGFCLVNGKKYKEAVEVLKAVADAPGEYRDLGS